MLGFRIRGLGISVSDYGYGFRSFGFEDLFACFVWWSLGSYRGIPLLLNIGAYIVTNTTLGFLNISLV